jgi:hypothetical protein
MFRCAHLGPVAAVTALLLGTTGCIIPTVSTHTTRNVAILLTEIDSGKPAVGVPVHVVYASDFLTPVFLHVELRVPREVMAETDREGRAIIPLADYRLTYLSISTNDWRSRCFFLKKEVIREGGTVEEPQSEVPPGVARLRLFLQPARSGLNKPVQATAAAPFLSYTVGDSLLPGFGTAQFTAAVPDLIRWARMP